MVIVEPPRSVLFRLRGNTAGLLASSHIEHERERARRNYAEIHMDRCDRRRFAVAATHRSGRSALFNQGPPNGNNFDITDYRLADDFSVPASVSLDHIGFWYQAQDQSDLAAVTLRGVSGSWWRPRGAAGSSALSTTRTLPTIHSRDYFSPIFPIAPLAVPGGSTYWLGIARRRVIDRRQRIHGVMGRCRRQCNPDRAGQLHS